MPSSEIQPCKMQRSLLKTKKSSSESNCSRRASREQDDGSGSDLDCYSSSDNASKKSQRKAMSVVKRRATSKTNKRALQLNSARTASRQQDNGDVSDLGCDSSSDRLPKKSPCNVVGAANQATKSKEKTETTKKQNRPKRPLRKHPPYNESSF